MEFEFGFLDFKVYCICGFIFVVFKKYILLFFLDLGSFVRKVGSYSYRTRFVIEVVFGIIGYLGVGRVWVFVFCFVGG